MDIIISANLYKSRLYLISINIITTARLQEFQTFTFPYNNIKLSILTLNTLFVGQVNRINQIFVTIVWAMVR